MTTLYIIRHGETAGNDAGRFQGSTDCELNERGYAQAERLGERCRDLPFEVLISSPLVRARETAFPSAKPTSSAMWPVTLGLRSSW